MLVVPRILGLWPAALVSSVLIPACLTAGELPERTVRGKTVVSSHDPSARIELPASATYVGSERWVLEAYADDIEMHVFVDVDGDKYVKHIYWVQFEAYLPSRPELKHNYDSARHMSLGGMDFYVDTWAERTDRSEQPDSDGAYLRALLRSRGYTLPGSMLSVRFVHLMDHGRRELMFIYSEDSATAGITPEQSGTGGRAQRQWLVLQPRLIRRGRLSFTID